MLKQFLRSVLLVSACMAIATPSYSVIYVDKVDHPRKVVILKIEGLNIGKDVARKKITLNFEC